MRTALFLLLLLAIGAIPGSTFPQRSIDPARTAQWIADHPTAGPVLDRLGFFEVYASPWFAAIYLLLFVSLVGCVLPRSRVHWQAMRPPGRPARTGARGEAGRTMRRARPRRRAAPRSLDAARAGAPGCRRFRVHSPMTSTRSALSAATSRRPATSSTPSP